MYKFIFTLLLGAICTSCHKEDWARPGALVPLTVDQDQALPSLNINGTQLHAENFGNPSDPLLIIIHGGPGADYRSLLNAKSLVDDGFHVIFYDQRGSGLSKRENKSQYDGPQALQLYVDDLEALIAHFQIADTQKVFLLGHSWGAILATSYINQYPDRISGAVLAEPGGFTWTQTSEFIKRERELNVFSETLSDALFPEEILNGRSEDEIIDYKAGSMATFANVPGNLLGNDGNYPFWRIGGVCFNTLIHTAQQYGFDFTTNLNQFPTKVLFMYSEKNQAYGLEWAEAVSAPYPNVELQMVENSGHEMLYFGWTDMYPKVAAYLNALK
jgi:proline iminopeptidase